MADPGSRRGGGCRIALPSLALLAPLLLLALASCRRVGEDQPALPPDQLANAIEDVRVIKETPPPEPKRLGILTPADLGRVTGGIACTLRQGDDTLLVAGTARALARVDGRPVLLDIAGPMDASAAFFQAPRVTISIGRHNTVAPQADAPGIAWPVGVTVGAMPQADDQKLDATWSCAEPRKVIEPPGKPR